MKLGFPIGAAVAAAALSLSGGPAGAHHSFAEFDRSRSVTVEGVVERVEWSNPHVRLYVRTADGVEYEVQWWATQRMRRAGLPENPFAIGDEIVLTGSVHRDPEVHVLTLVTNVSRPADGWEWRKIAGWLGDSGRVEEAPADP